MPDSCFSCLRGLHATCRHTDNNPCSCYGFNHETISDGVGSDEGDNESSGPHTSGTDSTKRFRRTKPDAALKDQQSTGRKRAAGLYPLNRDADCEWRFGLSCGGGESPIQGCIDGKQLARHHGPEKNTLNNDPGNVHRICHHCHNRWHAANDKDYDPNKPLKD
jgi:hypothetical protein